MWKRIAPLLAASLLVLSPCIAQDAADDFNSGGGENASNPLSKVKNTDVRIQYFDNTDKGIGFGADQIAPFFGMAMVKKPGWVFIPLIQQFLSYSGVGVRFLY